MFCSSKRSAGVSGGALCHSVLRDLKVDRCSLPLLATFEFVGDLLVFVQLGQSCSLNGRYVNEYVLRAVIGLDKSIALLGVEPFYRSASHCKFLRKQHDRHPALGDGSNLGTERKVSPALDGELARESRRTSGVDSNNISYPQNLYNGCRLPFPILSGGHGRVAGVGESAIKSPSRGFYLLGGSCIPLPYLRISQTRRCRSAACVTSPGRAAPPSNSTL